MSILSPTGDPASDKKLWWRCVFIAAAVQPFLILLYLIFQTAFFRIIMMTLYLPCVILGGLAIWTNPGALSFLYLLLPVCIVLDSFILCAIFYFVCWLKEKDF